MSMAAGSRPAAVAARRILVERAPADVGIEEDGEPAIGDLTGQREVPGSDRGQVDRHLRADGLQGQHQGLARSVRQRQGEVLARRSDPGAGRSPAARSVRTPGSCRADRRSAHRASPRTPAGRTRRVPAGTGRPTAHRGGRRHRRHRRGPTRNLEDRGTDGDARGGRRDRAQHYWRHRCRRPRPPRPRRSRFVCGNRQPQVVLQLGGRSRIAQIESKSHVLIATGRPVVRLSARTGVGVRSPAPATRFAAMDHRRVGRSGWRVPAGLGHHDVGPGHRRRRRGSTARSPSSRPVARSSTPPTSTATATPNPSSEPLYQMSSHARRRGAVDHHRRESAAGREAGCCRRSTGRCAG